MRREYLIAIVVIALLAGGVFAIYQFYLKERLERYAKDQLKLEQLTEKYVDLKKKFNNTQPKAVIEDVANRVNPWKEAVDQRGSYFNVGDFKEFEPVPDDVLSYKLYYLEKAPEVYNTFNEYLRGEGKENSVLSPQQLWFHAPTPNRVKNLRPDKSDVGVWLGAMQFGHSYIKMFVDANVISLRQMNLWRPRVDRQVLEAYTAGAEFEMTMDNLVVFLDKLRFDRDRYYDVNAIRIKNRYLMGPYAKDPWLEVEMLVTTTEYKKGATVKLTRGATKANAANGGRSGRDLLFDRRTVKEDVAVGKRSFLDKVIRWMPF